jgi:hypothetical protein
MDIKGAGDGSKRLFANRCFWGTPWKGKKYLGTSISHLYGQVAAPEIDGKRRPIFGGDFVMHCLRHTMLTRLGESGVDDFTIMRIAGQSSGVVSQRYAHSTPEAVERPSDRLQLHASASIALDASPLGVPTILPTVRKAVAVSH